MNKKNLKKIQLKASMTLQQKHYFFLGYKQFKILEHENSCQINITLVTKDKIKLDY